MPPQPGSFPIPSGSKTTKTKDDETHKDKKRKDLAGRLGKEMSDRRDEQSLASARIYNEPIQLLHNATIQLATRPDTSHAYNLCLYPLSLERSALLGQLVVEERHALDVVEAAFDEERDKVEVEYKKGRDRIRDRLLEGIEERRKRAREEREGDGGMGDPSLDTSSRGHPTRKLRNKLGGSPPPNILPYPPAVNPTAVSAGPIYTASITNPLSLSVDELPSPFPLPLIVPNNAASTYVTTGPNGKKKTKGGQKDLGIVGKAAEKMTPCKEVEVEADLSEIRRLNKRRRQTLASLAAKAAA